ncbi:MAG: hypothetical protein Q7W13_01360 [Bacteroidia bacterium]|nr:hypothetical protein [Bacteroidia bacterium]
MKTKLFILLLFTSFTAFAQLEKERKWQIGVNINTVEPITEAGFDYAVNQTRIFNDATAHRTDKSTSFGINLSYQTKDKCVLRLVAKMTQYKIDERYDSREAREITTAPSSDYILDTGYIRQSVYTISPGIVWNFSYKKLNIYGGFQLVYKKYSPTEIDLRYAFYNTSNDSLTSAKYYIIREGGGYSLGLGPVTGFSVNVFKNFSIGAEFSSAYTYYKRGGETSWFLQFTYPPQNAGNSGTIISHGTYEAYKFSSVLSSVNISYNF